MSESITTSDRLSRLDYDADEALLRALDASAGQLADEVLLLFAAFMPEAHGWSETRRREFVTTAKGRLQAVLAIVGLSTEVDAGLEHELRGIGSTAAVHGSSLPHLLIVLRISRDLLLQNAIRLSRENKGWEHALTLFSARLLPVIDRLTDGITNGYWETLLDENEEERHRLATIVESKPEAVYEADIDGIVRFVNNSFTLLMGQPADRLIGRRLSEILPVDGNVIGVLLAERVSTAPSVQVAMKAADGVLRPYEIATVVRRIGSEVLGFGGIVRRVDSDSSISL